MAGRTEEARKIVDEFVASAEGQKNAYFTGCLYSVIGDKEKAFESLERSYSTRQADLVSMKIDPALDNLRDDPRYADLLRRAHLDGE